MDDTNAQVRTYDIRYDDGDFEEKAHAVPGWLLWNTGVGILASLLVSCLKTKMPCLGMRSCIYLFFEPLTDSRRFVDNI